MNTRPSGTNREIQVTGGLFGNMTQTEVIIEKPKPSQETPSEQGKYSIPILACITLI